MKLKDTRLRYIAAASALIVAGAAAFAFGRYAVSEDAPVGAQTNPERSAGTPVFTLDPKGTPFPPGTPVYVAGPDGTPVIHIPSAPHPDIAAAMTAIAEDNQKPRFIGELNGFQFIPMDIPVPENDICATEDVQVLYSSEARAALTGSRLDFELRYVPSGLNLVREITALCGEEVIVAELAYEGSNGRLLEVGRVKGKPIIPSFAPEDRLESLSIGGRPSVLVKPISHEPTVIFMRDDEGTLWTINADEIDMDEGLKVAEEIQ